MGSTLVIRSHADADVKKITEWVRAIQEDDAFRMGNEYSGGWNMCRGTPNLWANKIFASEKEAHDFIADNHSKWEALLGVRYRLKSKETEPASLTKLRASKQEVSQAKYDFPNVVFDKVVAGKSQFRACPNCQSRIAVKRLSHKSINCPVCKSVTFMLTPTLEKNLHRLQEKEAELMARISEAEKQLMAKQKNKNLAWLVGGWCAE